jgi:uncharacterized protein
MADLDALTTIRRINRKVDSEEWMHEFLAKSATCVIGLRSDDRVVLNPNTFVFDVESGIFYFHTAGQGRTRESIEQHPEVTVTVFEMGRLLPGKVVTDFTTEYASVTLFGRAEIVSDLAEMRHLFEMQMQKYFAHLVPGQDYIVFTDEEMQKATVYRVTIERWTAKVNQGKPDHVGAIWYPWRYFRG